MPYSTIDVNEVNNNVDNNEECTIFMHNSNKHRFPAY
jgi:hypothetical protein